MKNLKEHWENIYETKDLKEMSWYQEKPETSLAFIKSLEPDKKAKIIDVGGGDSFLVDHLLAEGYENITVLDLSEEALEKAKRRLGEKAAKVTWIVANAADFEPKEKYDVWHDRATFHFLTEEDQIKSYKKTLEKAVKEHGHVILGTFSEKGPEKCSGIKIRQYSLNDLTNLFKERFEKLHCENIDHVTPGGGVQNFSFCSFRKIEK